jgi:hypothetical protein
MIDIKENGEAVIAALIKLLSSHRSVFDRSVNKKALQIVISGDRTISSKWSSYPTYIYLMAALTKIMTAQQYNV